MLHSACKLILLMLSMPSLQAIAEVLARGMDIRYRHVVTSIDWREGEVIISCTNGSAFKADAVVITVSLGVLKVSHKQRRLALWHFY